MDKQHARSQRKKKEKVGHKRNRQANAEGNSVSSETDIRYNLPNNWDRYVEPLEAKEDYLNTKAADFRAILEAPSSTGASFYFRNEKEWENLKTLSDCRDDIFNLDTTYLNNCLRSVPFHELFSADFDSQLLTDNEKRIMFENTKPYKKKAEEMYEEEQNRDKIIKDNSATSSTVSSCDPNKKILQLLSEETKKQQDELDEILGIPFREDCSITQRDKSIQSNVGDGSLRANKKLEQANIKKEETEDLQDWLDDLLN